MNVPIEVRVHVDGIDSVRRQIADAIERVKQVMSDIGNLKAALTATQTGLQKLQADVTALVAKIPTGDGEVVSTADLQGITTGLTGVADGLAKADASIEATLNPAPAETEAPAPAAPGPDGSGS